MNWKKRKLIQYAKHLEERQAALSFPGRALGVTKCGGQYVFRFVYDSTAHVVEFVVDCADVLRGDRYTWR